MATSPDPEDKPRRRTSNHAAAAEARDELVRQLLEKERAALDAKTLKLRALRLAREEEKRSEATKKAEAFLAAMQRKANDDVKAAPEKKAAKVSRSAVNQKKPSAPAKRRR